MSVPSAQGGAWRLAAGGRIDRVRSMRFRFDGTEYSGFAGDTLASALLANGVRIVGRSFRLHRPRGLFGQWSEEPNAIVQIGHGARLTPNLKATQVELTQGLDARSVNAWPSARYDALAALQLLAPLVPAGFYYKTFKWPGWRWYEPLIRRAAGLGQAPTLPDPDVYDERHLSCDVLVVGAGPAGLAAALAAARAGARVVLIEDRPVLGGALQWEAHTIDARGALEWVAAAEGELRGLPAARVLTRATAFGAYDHNLIGVCERRAPGDATNQPSGGTSAFRERLWKIRAREVVLATGAIERPLLFAGNDVPGVMLACAAMSYAAQYAVRPGRRAVILTAGDSAYEAALALQECGVEIAAIVDARPQASSGALAAAARLRGVRFLYGYVPVTTHGRRAVEGITVRPHADAPRAQGSAGERLACDLVCVSGGWSPTVHLYSQAGGTLRYRAEIGALVPSSPRPGLSCAGAVTGTWSLGSCLADGFAMGGAAARRTGASGYSARLPEVATHPEPRTSALSVQTAPGVRARRIWVDLQNDVTRADLELAVRENLVSVEHVKRYTTCGMAVDQGKTSNVNALALLAASTGRSLAELGTTRFRPPYDPVTLGTLAAGRIGPRYHPLRRTPLDAWHAAHGAVMDDFGGWRRPAWYARAGCERAECVRLEKRAVRAAVSLFDGSPLGKIEVFGPDAALFLERMYATPMLSLAPQRVRYGIMLNEHGIVIDDGVCMRLGPERFLVSTTSGGAARIFAQFEDWLQCEWPQLRVLVTNVTSAWATIAVAGPQARALLERLDTDIDLRREDFPHMAVRAGTLEGVRVRIARVGFTGELSYEVSVSPGYARSLWERLLDVGQDFNIAPIGIDALQALRTEKGFLHVGSDTDGRTIPADVGMGAAAAKKTEDFVGRRSLTRADALRGDRLQFVGIAAEDPSIVLPIGAHLLSSPRAPAASQGYITSSCSSEVLGRGVALALARAGRARMGERVYAYHLGRTWPATIVSHAWYDPRAERINA